MKKIDSLIKEARKSCKFRGHKMMPFKKTATTAYSECKLCGRGVTIDTHPLPNGIDIGGSAVAMNCTPNWGFYGGL